MREDSAVVVIYEIDADEDLDVVVENTGDLVILLRAKGKPKARIMLMEGRAKRFADLIQRRVDELDLLINGETGEAS